MHREGLKGTDVAIKHHVMVNNNSSNLFYLQLSAHLTVNTGDTVTCLTPACVLPTTWARPVLYHVK